MLNFKNGKLEGLQKVYSENGEVVANLYYKNGKCIAESSYFDYGLGRINGCPPAYLAAHIFPF